MMRRVAGRMRHKEMSDITISWIWNWTEAKNKARAERMMKRTIAGISMKALFAAVYNWKMSHADVKAKARAERMMRRVAGRIMMKEMSDSVMSWSENFTAVKNKARGERMMRRVAGRIMTKELAEVLSSFISNWTSFKKVMVAMGHGRRVMKRVMGRITMRSLSDAVGSWRYTQIKSMLQSTGGQHKQLQRQVKRQAQSLVWWRHMLTMRILSRVAGNHIVATQMSRSLGVWVAKLTRLRRLTGLFSHSKDARVLGATSLLLIVRQHFPPHCRQSDLNGRQIFDRSNALELLRSGFSILRCLLGWKAAMMEDSNTQGHKDGVFTAARIFISRHVKRAARQNERCKALLFWHGTKCVISSRSSGNAIRAFERNFIRSRQNA